MALDVAVVAVLTTGAVGLQARHAFGSYLIHKGVPIPVVARLLGHADNGVLLMQTYAHVLETGSREQVMEALAAVGL